MDAVTVIDPEVTGLTTKAPVYWLVLKDDKPSSEPEDTRNDTVIWLYMSW